MFARHLLLALLELYIWFIYKLIPDVRATIIILIAIHMSLAFGINVVCFQEKVRMSVAIENTMAMLVCI